MTESVLTIDPGEATGWSLWALDPKYPIQRLEYGLVKGGTDGFITFMELRLGRLHPDVLIVEDWNRHDPRKGDPTHPLQIKGALMGAASALGVELIIQPNTMKDQCHDSVLKEHGLYILPREAKVDPAIMHTDGRDVNDTQRHTLGWAKVTEHQPTIALYWPDR